MTATEVGAPQPLFLGGEGGYACYRIPALVKAPDGSLLAFAEARVHDCADTGFIDLVVRRSSDDGATWGSAQRVGHDSSGVFGNPAPVVDQVTRTVWLLSTHNAAGADDRLIRRGEMPPQEGRRVYVQSSGDAGASWSEPREITEHVAEPDWRWYATGPGHGIQLTRGPHAGRLLIPANHSGPPTEAGGTGEEFHCYGGHLIYSDDHGASWQLGAVDRPGTGKVNPNESTLAELPDGRVYCNTRSQRGSDPGTRGFTTSSDGGTSFDRSYESSTTPPVPVVQAAVLPVGPDGGRLVMSAPDAERPGSPMTLWTSEDAGRSWRRSHALGDGPRAYSDMVALDEGHIGLVYEGGVDGQYEAILYNRVAVAALSP